MTEDPKFSSKHYAAKSEKSAIRSEESNQQAQLWAIRSEDAAHTTLRDVVNLGTFKEDSEIELASNVDYILTIEDTEIIEELPEGIEAEEPVLVSPMITFVPKLTEEDPQYHIQIKLYLTVKSTAPVISWGTTFFFNGAEPEIEEPNYIIYWDYDNHTKQWICGNMLYKEAE